MSNRKRSDIVEMSNSFLHLANPLVLDISTIFELKSVQKYSLDILVFECIQPSFRIYTIIYF